MFENDVFDTWLDAKSKEIILKLDKEKLTSEEMIILMLKAQTNHFAHLDIDLRHEMSALNKDLRHEMSELNKELRHEMSELNKELRQEMIDLRRDMDKRFEQVDKRFEQVDKRFEQVDKRFEALTTRIDRFMIWSFATTLAIGAGIVAAIRYLPAVS
jgi:predicted  nucleic acid-binding Zn-ribbon protein